MRLLCTTKLKIIDIPHDAVPPYAILSHTWGRDEVTFQDLRSLEGGGSRNNNDNEQKQQQHIKAKAGLAKVRDSAALARSRGLSLIWIDTCCIDKTSSAELSEAINSMYRWYQEAQECYAFLSDVEGENGNENIDGQLQENEEKQDNGKDNKDANKIAKGFASSRWFTRGWTLQELIAPQTVLFYNKHWKYLGSKNDSKGMPAVLSRITGIDRGVLAGHMQPSDLSVASRMKWAADRRTTRMEDLAYCLMGIFDVNMPLLYGEGTKAFIRLQEEILRVTDDQSIFAWAILDSANGSLEEICGLLATHPRQFKDIRPMNPLPPLLGRESVPSSFTNQGLRVQLQLRPVADVEGVSTAEAVPEEYIAILDCSITTGVSHFWPALHLQRLWNDQFARIRPNICRYLPAPVVAGSEYQVVYVKQKPKHVIPELFVPMSTISHGLMFMNLEDVYPTTRWNPHSMTLKSVYSSGNGVMGVFRFTHKGNLEDKVDVIVGIRPSEFQLKTRQVTWEAWCFQRRCDGRALREVFESWDKALLQSSTFRPSLVEYQSIYGEDHRLLSSASVVETMMYGRLFFSVQVLKRQELDINAELVPSDSSVFSTDGNHAIQGPSLEDLTSELTGPCFTTTFFGEEKARLKKGVRTRERFNSNWLPLVSGLKAHPTMDADPPQAKRKTGDWVRFTRSLASGSISMEPWNSKLLEACRRGDHDKVKELLRRGASVNCCTRNTQFNPWGFTMEGLTPLHWAIITKSESIISELMHEGANIMAASTGGWNALHFLALRYDTDEPLPRVVAEKLESMPQEDLTTLARGKVSDMFETPLHILCGRKEGNTALFDILANDALGLRRDRNTQGELPLHRAAAAGNLHAVAFFVENLAREGYLDAQDEELRTPVWHAAGSGSGNGNGRGRPTGAATVEPLIRLLDAGASANLADNLGRTPLHIACREGRTEAVRVLLQYGAYAASPSAYLSMTPYHFAALFESEQCLLELIEQRPPAYREFDQLAKTGGGDSTGTGAMGAGCSFTPLHLAAGNGWLAGVMMLVTAGANLELGCTHYLRKGPQMGTTSSTTTTTMLAGTAAPDDSAGRYTPELFELSAASVFDLVDMILASKLFEDWEEPGLRQVQQFLKQIPRALSPASLVNNKFPEYLQQQEQQQQEDTVARPRTATGTTNGGGSALAVEREGGNRSRKHTIESHQHQESGFSNQREDVVDLSSYDGGVALDLPTPGLSPDAKMKFGVP